MSSTNTGTREKIVEQRALIVIHEGLKITLPILSMQYLNPLMVRACMPFKILKLDSDNKRAMSL